MIMFGLTKKSGSPATANESAGVEHYDIDPNDTDRYTATLLKTLDKAVSVQSSSIVKYVDGLRKRNPTAAAREVQDLLDKHFRTVASGTGATAGAAAAVPGIGLFTGIAAVGAESIVFLDAAAWYILASAYIRGADIKGEETRRGLVLLVLTGSKGSAVVDALVGDLGGGGLPSAAVLSRFSAPTLANVNSRLGKLFLKQITKRMKWAWVSKLMPLGVGAVLGTMANRKLAQQVIDHAHQQLDPLGA